MKVVCIDDRWVGVCEHIRSPKFGEECVVASTEKGDDGEWYSLCGFTGYWETAAFAPLSDIDETELINEREMAEVGVQ